MNILMNLNTSVIALGAFFLVFAVIQYFRLRKLTVKGIKTTAIIKDFEDALHNMRFPILEYRTLTGEVITQKSYIGSKRGVQNIGDKVNIVYNPNKPWQFLLDTGMAKYWKILGAAIMGAAFAASGFLHMWGK
ncbi:MAG TPA: DUF3592 domain-containing protein [Bacteroidales bacterium]|nr:DUF3592 domain-containing protein [Bacteroidales bacterium]